MLTLVLPRTAEPSVIHLTQEQLQKELSPVIGSELLVVDSWGEGIAKCRTEFICLVEADCEVNSGYFSSLIGLFRKNPQYRQLGVMSSSTAVKSWANKLYGFKLGRNWTNETSTRISMSYNYVEPIREQRSTEPYYLGIAYIPGAVMRMSTLKRVLEDLDKFEAYSSDLVYFSTMMSLEFLRKGSRLSIAPNSTYVTTEEYVGDIARFDVPVADLFEQLQANYRSKNFVQELF